MPDARTLIEDALREIGVVSEDQTPLGPDAARGLRILNRDIMDPWSAQTPFAFGRVFTTGTFAASTQTRLVGPTGSGSFVVTPRPTRIVSAQRVDTASTPDIYDPLHIRDSVWFAGLSSPLMESTYITDLYYDPTVPNGTLYAWPVPSGTQTVRIETERVVTSFATLDTSLDLAPGYESAITHTLKELFCHAWGRPLPDGLAEMARKAREIVTVNNLRQPRRARTDAPSTGDGGGSDIQGFRTRNFS